MKHQIIPVTFNIDQVEQCVSNTVNADYHIIYDQEDIEKGQCKTDLDTLQYFYNLLMWQRTEAFEIFWNNEVNKACLLFLYITSNVWPEYTGIAQRAGKNATVSLFKEIPSSDRVIN